MGSSTHGCWLGSYEYEKRIAFERMLKGGSTVLDVGAHVGFYSLLASVLVGATGQVFAFEPLPRNLRYLRQHLWLNQIKNVEVVECAVSECSGVALFEEGSDAFTGRLSDQGKMQVRTVSLDEFVDSNTVPAPNYIKIDVEGAELSVLRGAASTLARYHPCLFLSTHGGELHSQCCDFLRALDFELHPIVGESIEQADELLALRRV